MRAAWYEQQGAARDVLTVSGRVRLGQAERFFCFAFSHAGHKIAVMRPFFTSLFLSVIGGAASWHKTSQSPQQTLTPKEIKWPAAAAVVGTSRAAGLQTVVLKGDPTKAGLYTMLLRLPPNTKIQAHSHKDDRTASGAVRCLVFRLWARV